MDKDLKELLSVFNAHRVKYVIIGGYAIAIHAQPRATGDLDVFIESSPSNACAVYEALAEYGAPLQGVTAKDFEDTHSFFQIGISPVRIDIINRIDGVEFGPVWEASSEYLVDGEVRARYISADHLVANKLASGRPQDLADVDAIRRASAHRKSQ